MITEHWRADHFLDAKGLACPMPLLKLKQQLNRMQPGESIRVETTDVGSIRDFDAFCKQAGHSLQAQIEVDESSATAAASPVMGGGKVYGFLILKCDLSANQG